VRQEVALSNLELMRGRAFEFPIGVTLGHMIEDRGDN
jgi:hypothetical protein